MTVPAITLHINSTAGVIRQLRCTIIPCRQCISVTGAICAHCIAIFVPGGSSCSDSVRRGCVSTCAYRCVSGRIYVCTCSGIRQSGHRSTCSGIIHDTGSRSCFDTDCCLHRPASGMCCTIIFIRQCVRTGCTIGALCIKDGRPGGGFSVPRRGCVSTRTCCTITGFLYRKTCNVIRQILRRNDRSTCIGIIHVTGCSGFDAGCCLHRPANGMICTGGAVALNGICRSRTLTTRTVDQSVTGVTGGCNLIGARSTRDRGRVGTVATRSTGTTRGAGGASAGVGVRS